MTEEQEGVSSVLGSVLMLALMAMLVPGAMLLQTAIRDEIGAHREAAERAAYCARHPEVRPPTCPERGPMEGYACEEVEADTWVCRPQNLTPPVTPPSSKRPVP